MSVFELHTFVEEMHVQESYIYQKEAYKRDQHKRCSDTQRRRDTHDGAQDIRVFELHTHSMRDDLIPLYIEFVAQFRFWFVTH